jgi:hypothetical protein
MSNGVALSNDLSNAGKIRDSAADSSIIIFNGSIVIFKDWTGNTQLVGLRGGAERHTLCGNWDTCYEYCSCISRNDLYSLEPNPCSLHPRLLC